MGEGSLSVEGALEPVGGCSPASSPLAITAPAIQPPMWVLRLPSGLPCASKNRSYRDLTATWPPFCLCPLVSCVCLGLSGHFPPSGDSLLLLGCVHTRQTHGVEDQTQVLAGPALTSCDFTQALTLGLGFPFCKQVEGARQATWQVPSSQPGSGTLCQLGASPFLVAAGSVGELREAVVQGCHSTSCKVTERLVHPPLHPRAPQWAAPPSTAPTQHTGPSFSWLVRTLMSCLCR